jgi:hypothetical protein
MGPRRDSTPERRIMALTPEQARAASLARKTISGGKEGRPLKKGRRCPCGKYLLATAKQRGHKCVKP